MADPIFDLTEKEKEALRLLFAGHDAKSAALELDISVHTLNDRLRAARRKLGVTTSKEAARALAEAEQADPQNASAGPPESFVHKPLGVREGQENQDIPQAADRSGGGFSAFASRRKGILIMSLALALSLAAIAFLPSQSPEASGNTFTAETEFVAERPSASELQARRWLGLIDFGKFDESYEEAGAPLREEYSLGKWKFGLTLRMTKGKLKDRSLATVMRTSEFEGRKGGEFEVITFDSLFQYENEPLSQHDNHQIERVVLEKIGADWKVVDYEITPRDKS